MAIERNIARCRVILSAAALVTAFVDPTRPMLLRWSGGPFTLDPRALAVLLAYVAYALAIAVTLRGGVAPATRVGALSAWVDVVFAAAIALVTEGANSPGFPCFAFAILAAGFRTGFRATAGVTAASIGLYLALILVSRPEGLGFYVMRPAYLAITAWLAGDLAEQRRHLEAHVRDLETARERERIARSLHDGCVQSLAAVNLRVETCRELLRRGRSNDALVELTELQTGINREHDDLRAYIHSLVDRDATPDRTPTGAARFTVRARFDGSLRLVEHALQIVLEAARNVGRHAHAGSAAVVVEAQGERIVITVDDDGVGFPAGAGPPWSIASRAAELGGVVRVGGRSGRGPHLEIELAEA
jgi:signal transduction histidine kinase